MYYHGRNSKTCMHVVSASQSACYIHTPMCFKTLSSIVCSNVAVSSSCCLKFHFILAQSTSSSSSLNFTLTLDLCSVTASISVV